MPHNDPSSHVQETDPKVRQSVYQRFLIWLVANFGHAPEVGDPPRNTVFGWFGFVGMLASGSSMLGLSIGWIASGEYKDAWHPWHNQVTRGIQVPIYFGLIGLLLTLYAFTLRPRKAQEQATKED